MTYGPNDCMNKNNEIIPGSLADNVDCWINRHTLLHILENRVKKSNIEFMLMLCVNTF